VGKQEINTACWQEIYQIRPRGMSLHMWEDNIKADLREICMATQVFGAGFLIRGARYNPLAIHVGSVVDKVALDQVSLRIVRFSPKKNKDPYLFFITPEVCDRTDQLERYQSDSLQFVYGSTRLDSE